MHKRATLAVVGFVAVVVIAAALDAVFFRNHAPASTQGTLSDPSSSAPPCRSNQLKLRINRGGPKHPRHDDYVTLNHIRGGVCNFPRRQTRIWTFTPDGRGRAESWRWGRAVICRALTGRAWADSSSGSVSRRAAARPGRLPRASKLGTTWTAGRSRSTAVESSRLPSDRTFTPCGTLAEGRRGTGP